VAAATNPEAVQAKLVASRRGGYCFEQNTLMKLVLEALGFTVTALAARVVWMAAPGAPLNPRGHMLLKVEGEGVTHAADVGFGGVLAASPVPLPAGGEAGPEAPVPGGALRVRQTGALYHMQVWQGGEWRDAYCFTMEPQYPIDIEVANWYMSTHPSSRFRNGLMLQRLLPDGRIALLNRSFTRRFAGGEVQERTIASAEELERVIQVEFGIEPPPGLGEAFVRLA
jgi:N-hydroxyarylamine O-acetyltransferase